MHLSILHSVSISGSNFGFQTWLYLWHSKPMLPYHGDAYGNSRTYLEFSQRRRSSSNACVRVTSLSQREILRKFLASVSLPPKSEKVSRNL
ncbi:hypothetical protein VNO77_04375 [Canavalia gladiata]|uniref:Uncharacterized protein n=1 Tax=Canavalia gladiata TaxID=3824 RepID=A0AAN9MWE4_CANGL